MQSIFEKEDSLVVAVDQSNEHHHHRPEIETCQSPRLHLRVPIGRCARRSCIASPHGHGESRFESTPVRFTKVPSAQHTRGAIGRRLKQTHGRLVRASLESIFGSSSWRQDYACRPVVNQIKQSAPLPCAVPGGARHGLDLWVFVIWLRLLTRDQHAWIS